MKRTLAVFWLLASTAFAVPLLPEGTYETQGTSHYLDHEIQLSHWSNKLKMTATLKRGKHRFPVEVTLDRVGERMYRGSGYITVRYPDGSGCRHRVGARLWAHGDHFFLRENTPRGIPYNPGGACTAAGPYVWFDHPKPYDFIQ